MLASGKLNINLHAVWIGHPWTDREERLADIPRGGQGRDNRTVSIQSLKKLRRVVERDRAVIDPRYCYARRRRMRVSSGVKLTAQKLPTC